MVMALDGTMNIAGKPVKKETVYIGIAAVAIVGIGMYRYRKQQQQAAADAAANAAAQAPGTGAGSSDQVDPATGFPYGSQEDAAALTAQSGYITPYGAGGGTQYLYGGYPPTPSSTMPGGFTSNAQWSQAAEDYLVNTTGADANTVGNALGKYITGQTVSDAQEAIINQAIAFEGMPPVAGPQGYPPSIRKAIPTPTPTPQTTVAVPKITGMRAGDAHNVIVAAGLVPKDTAAGTRGEYLWTVVYQNPAAGTKVPPHTTVTFTGRK